MTLRRSRRGRSSGSSGGSGLLIRLHGGGFSRGGFDDDSGVFGEVDLLAFSDPAVVDGPGCAVVTDAGGSVGGDSGEADDGADQAQAGGSAYGVFAEHVTAAADLSLVLIERAAGHESEEDGQADLVLRFRFRLTLGGESNVACGICSSEPGLDDAGLFVGNLKLAKAKGENAGAAELARRFGAGDVAD